MQNKIIDKYSYHVFEYNSTKFLYDINTANICAINDLAFLFFKLLCKNNWKTAIKKIQNEFSDFKEEDGIEIITSLMEKGFFKFEKIDKKKQKEWIDKLWKHQPRRIQLFLAQKCNLKCIYCYGENNNSNAKNKLMDFETAKQGVDFLIKRSGNRKNLQVTFFGGEPLLNFKVLKKIVNYCLFIEKKYNKIFEFELITNGTLLNKEICDYIVKKDFLLFISLDGWEEMNNTQRPSANEKNYFDNILKNAKYLVEQYRINKSKKRIKIRANLTNKFCDLNKTYSYLENQGFDLIGIAAIESKLFENNTPGALTANQMLKLKENYNKLYLNALEDIKIGKKLSPFTNRSLQKLKQSTIKNRNILGIRCGINRNTAAVDTDGNIFPCHRYVGLDKYITGNIFSGMDYNSTIDLYNKYNDNCIEICEKCWIKNICGGPCPWELSASDGKIWKPDKKRCKQTRENVEFSLWLTYKLEEIKNSIN